MHTTYEAPKTIGRMLLLVQAFLYSLTPEQRRACEFPMDHPGRLDWDFIPKSDRTGIPISQLNFHQRTLVQTLLRAGAQHARIHAGARDHGDGEHPP